MSCATLEQSPFVFVACYNSFENLAHTPKGTPATYTIYTYRLDVNNGTLTLLSVSNTMANPAFLRFHPQNNLLYACSESISQDDQVFAFSVSPTSGLLKPLSQQSTSGRSACYLTLDQNLKHLLYVNYWDSSIGAFPLDTYGLLGPVKHIYRPQKLLKAGHRMDHLMNRQSETHAHAIVLDPYLGQVAYIPDLGEDVVKQFLYNSETALLTPAGTISADVMATKGPFGPRYLQFHPNLPTVYLVNELSSSISVFEFDPAEAHLLSAQGLKAEQGQKIEQSEFRSTLNQIQSISTIPFAFPQSLNTCGRITVDPTGKFVLVSNRGHNSIAIFSICPASRLLTEVGYYHTRGKTPRHFQFDRTGKYLIVANQDTDSIAIFVFNQENGTLMFTGNAYDVPSPNFVCVCEPYCSPTGVLARL